MKYRRVLYPVFLIIWSLTACSPQPARSSPGTPGTGSNPPNQVLNVYAAASLTEAFGEAGKAFEAQHPGLRVVLNFAGSQQLLQQIEQGASADVFASAAPPQMEEAVQSGHVDRSAVQTFAHNRLVVIFPKDNPAGITQLKDLSKNGIKMVLAAKAVPAGQYALAFLDKAAQDPSLGPGYKDAALKNVVSYEENVKAVLAKVALGEADAGIVYTSDLHGAYGTQVGVIDIPDSLNVIADYPVATIKGSASPELAQAFVAYILSKEGQQTLAKYGFIPVLK
ncbi:MAG: molybdate ABC transporter substrate-binding protein [Omnitrophica WOR_2 bacterium]